MKIKYLFNSSGYKKFCIGLGCIIFGITTGYLIGANLLFLVLALVAVIVIALWFKSYEISALVALILRTAIDSTSSPPLPSVMGAAICIMTLLYVAVLIFRRKTIQIDWFCWFFASWILLQGLWVLLLPLGGLGLDGSYLSESIREWIRIFSWLMVYLMIMQLKDKLSPQKVISILFLSLIIPLVVALLQIIVPSVLPTNLAPLVAEALGPGGSDGARIRGTIGHPNGFATYLFLFIGLTSWKLGSSKQKLPWLLLLSVLAFFYVSAKALFSLMMIGVFVLVLIAPRLSVLNLIAGILLFGIMIGLFASTPFGQERLGSIGNTPLLNPDIDVSRAILLSRSDGNSFNWRIAQWTYLWQRFCEFPLLGYGLGLTKTITTNHLEAHNDYVRALVEGGITGFTTFIGLFVVQLVRIGQLIKRSLPGSKHRNFCLVLLAILIPIPVGMITENIWSHTMLFSYWFSALAIAGWDWDEEKT
jgi:O-antigen ligase